VLLQYSIFYSTNFRPLPPEPTDGLWELQDDDDEDDIDVDDADAIGDADEIPKLEKVEKDSSLSDAHLFNVANVDDSTDSSQCFLKHRCGKEKRRSTIEEIETVL
jgi:hypothetical protein